MTYHTCHRSRSFVLLFFQFPVRASKWQLLVDNYFGGDTMSGFNENRGDCLVVNLDNCLGVFYGLVVFFPLLQNFEEIKTIPPSWLFIILWFYCDKFSPFSTFIEICFIHLSLYIKAILQFIIDETNT